MATTQIEFRIPTTSIEVVSSQHTVCGVAGHGVWNIDDACRIRLYTIGASSKDITEESILSIPCNLPDSCVITYLKFPMTCVVDNQSSSSLTLTLIVDGVDYGLSIDGNPTDNRIVTHMNEYKAQHGQFPLITFKMVSWMGSDIGTIDTVSVTITNPIIGCTIQGSKLISRPSSDLSKGHSSIVGSSTVYQAISEEVADDDSTYITSHTNNGTLVSETSDVGIVLYVPVKSLLKQLCVNFRIKHGSNTYGVSIELVSIKLSINGFSSSFDINYNSLLVTSEDKPNWRSYDVVFDENSDIVSGINAYVQQFGNTPQVQVAIKTAVAGADGAADGKSIGTSADIFLTQLYFNALYEEILGLNIHRKVNGAWVQAQAAYQKQNGVWNAISESDVKDYFLSGLVVDKYTMTNQ